jgi:hypothetical protein
LNCELIALYPILELALVQSRTVSAWSGWGIFGVLENARVRTSVDSKALIDAMVQKAGVDSQLPVDQALPRAFWYHYELPETREALDSMAGFFGRSWGGSSF